MARINTITLSLCALLFTLPYTASSHASNVATGSTPTHKAPQIQTDTTKTQAIKPRSKAKSTAKNLASRTRDNKKSIRLKTHLAASGGKHHSSIVQGKKSATPASAAHLANVPVWTEKCSVRQHKKHCIKVKSVKALALSDAHKARMQTARATAVNKLMGQLGKPYHWGGTSPRTGFDCSGLVYYAYKDLVKIPIPRTANEMYHLRDAAPVNRDELKSGDWVFFRTRGRGKADHVGVYVGNGKFIQSPRTGRDIQITSLNEEYWQRHYVGARRVVTPGTVR